MFDRSAGVLVALAFAGSGAPALAQSPPEPAACFELIPAQAKPYFTGTILLNRCNGATWLLARKRGNAGDFVYRWRPIAMGRTEAALQPVSSPNVKVPHIPKGRNKCFIFDGRQFCE